MNDAPANSPGLAESTSPGANWLTEPQRSEGWTRRRWMILIAFVFAAQIAMVFLIGEKKPPLPRAVTASPTLSFANDTDGLLALNDPTLFALPHQRDFAADVWLKLPEVTSPSFRWSEPPRWLPLSADSLGAPFVRLMQTNHFAGYPLDFKPALTLSTPVLPIEPQLPQHSTMHILGELAPRQLPAQIELTNWPVADLIAPSIVQVLVDAAGNVQSTVLLPPRDGFTAADQFDEADQRALALARTLRFAPSTGLTIGRIIFNWHTVPPEPTPDEQE
jgi:hypothetical protein